MDAQHLGISSSRAASAASYAERSSSDMMQRNTREVHHCGACSRWLIFFDFDLDIADVFFVL